MRPEQLAEAVRTVAAGEALVAPSVTRRLLETFVARPRPGARILAKLGLRDRVGAVVAAYEAGLIS